MARTTAVFLRDRARTTPALGALAAVISFGVHAGAQSAADAGVAPKSASSATPNGAPPPAAPVSAQGTPAPAQSSPPPQPANAPPPNAPPGYPPGQPPGPYYGPPAYPYPAYPAPAPPAQTPPGYHLHDGFYLRLGLGIGAIDSTFDYQPLRHSNMDVRSGAVGLDIWLGGTIIPGLVIGGGLVANSASDAKDRNSGLVSGLSQSMLLLFVDGFPSPTGGFDLGGGAGLATTSSPNATEAPTPDTTGIGFGIWGGYTGWVSDNWSIGGLARVGVAKTHTDSDGGISSRSLSFIVEFTGLYH